MLTSDDWTRDVISLHPKEHLLSSCLDKEFSVQIKAAHELKRAHQGKNSALQWGRHKCHNKNNKRWLLEERILIFWVCECYREVP